MSRNITYVPVVDLWAQFSDEELAGIFARKEALTMEQARRFERPQIEAMLTHRSTK